MTENSKEKVGGTQMLRSVYFELGRELITPGIYGAMKASNKLHRNHACYATVLSWKLGQGIGGRQRDE